MKFHVRAYRIEILSQTVVSDSPEEAVERAKAQPNFWYPGPLERQEPGWLFGADPVSDIHMVQEKGKYHDQPTVD